MSKRVRRCLLLFFALVGVVAVGRTLVSRPQLATPKPAPAIAGDSRINASFALRWGAYLTPQAVLSPDWSLLAQPSGSDVLLLRASDAQLLRLLKGAFPVDFAFASPFSAASSSAVVFSPDGNLVAAVGTYWPVDSPSIQKSAHDSEPVSAYLWLALWRVRDGRLLWRIQQERPHFNYHIQREARLRLLNDGTVKVLWQLKNTPLWTVRNGRIIREQTSPRLGQLGVFSRDWSRLALSANPALALNVQASGMSELPVQLPGGYPQAWSADGSLLALRGEQSAVYRVADGSVAWNIPRNALYNELLGFSPNGQWAITREEQGKNFESFTHLLRRAFDGQIVRKLPLETNGASPMPTFSQSSDVIALFFNGNLRFHHLPDGGLLREVSGQTLHAPSLALSPNNKMLAAVGKDLQLWDVANGRRIATIKHDGEALASLDWSPNGNFIVTGNNGAGNNDTLRLWRMRDRKIAWETRIGTMWTLSAVEFSPDGNLIAVACPGFPAQIFDARDGKRLAVLGAKMPGGHSLSQSRGDQDASTLIWLPDGQTLLSGGKDGLSVWSRDGQLQRQHREIADVVSLSLSPKGEQVLIGTSTGQIAMLRMHDGAIVWHWQLKNRYKDWQGVNVTFLSHGRVLSCHDQKIEMWDSESGAALRGALALPASPLKMVATGDGQMLAVAALNGLSLCDTMSGP